MNTVSEGKSGGMGSGRENNVHRKGGRTATYESSTAGVKAKFVL